MTTPESTLPAQVLSPVAARRAVREAMTGAGLEVILDDAVLLASELVTNAVVHAGTQIELHLDIGPGSVLVEVIDYHPGTLPALLGKPDADREAGRGMLLLDAVAKDWGTRHFAGGKAVWFKLGVTDRVAPRPLLRWYVPSPKAASSTSLVCPPGWVGRPMGSGGLTLGDGAHLDQTSKGRTLSHWSRWANTRVHRYATVSEVSC